MDGRFDFFVGLIMGMLLGGLGVYAMVRIRGWFASSELRRLQHDNRQLYRRIKQKDQHIEEMLHRAEVVARELQTARETDTGRVT